MDEIIQIVVFVFIMVAAAVQQTVKEKQKPKKALSPQEVPEEMFPEILQEEPMPEASPVVEPPVVKKKKPFTSGRPVETSRKKTPPPVQKTERPGGKKIHLNTREEARRAFIYSEIFNRKY